MKYIRKKGLHIDSPQRLQIHHTHRLTKRYRWDLDYRLQITDY